MHEIAPYEFLADLSTRIRLARKIRGIRSHQALADIIGVSRSVVTMWELGSSDPALVNLVQLRGTLRVTTDWLLTGDMAGLDQTTFEIVRKIKL